jgi:hypothetical protein
VNIALPATHLEIETLKSLTTENTEENLKLLMVGFEYFGLSLAFLCALCVLCG